MSLKLTGCPVMGFTTAGFLIFHARPASGLAMRIALCTLSSGVSVTRNALPVLHDSSSRKPKDMHQPASA
jgi:hypothetical protein